MVHPMYTKPRYYILLNISFLLLNTTYTHPTLKEGQYLVPTRAQTNKQIYCTGMTDGRPDFTLKGWYNRDELTNTKHESKLHTSN